MMMTKKLAAAFERAALLPDDQQDYFADWVMDELESERRWDALFAHSPDALAAMAADALKEHRAGQTQTLQPEKL